MAKKVLVVEDSEEISDIVCWVLEQKGYLVNVVKHCAAQQIAALKSDLIVLDEWLNLREGHMLCREIKAINEMKRVPVVIFSTAIDIETLVSDCGADGFVRKPFDIDDLIREVDRLLN